MHCSSGHNFVAGYCCSSYRSFGSTMFNISQFIHFPLCCVEEKHVLQSLVSNHWLPMPLLFDCNFSFFQGLLCYRFCFSLRIVYMLFRMRFHLKFNFALVFTLGLSKCTSQCNFFAGRGLQHEMLSPTTGRNRQVINMLGDLRYTE